MLADSGKFLAAHRGTENIGITGNGIIDGAGKRESDLSPSNASVLSSCLEYIIEDLGQIYKCPDTRPFLLFFVGVHGVTLRDVTFRDSALWTLRLTGYASPTSPTLSQLMYDKVRGCVDLRDTDPR